MLLEIFCDTLSLEHYEKIFHDIKTDIKNADISQKIYPHLL